MNAWTYFGLGNTRIYSPFVKSRILISRRSRVYGRVVAYQIRLR